ncbi:MAG: VOC family protein [Hyphococcus sp.]
MLKIEHVNLVVTDIEPTLTFLQAAFPEWRVRGEARDAWKGHPRRWLHFGDDDFYITLNDFGRGRQRDLASDAPGLAHIGFEVPSVDQVAARLKKAGYEPHHLGEDHPYRKNLYYIDGEGLEFEFVEYRSTVPARKNAYV